ncbi:MAG: hypothetical protein F4Z28_04875 [Gammaproteobacteria bacterium]|nr:hypothetical protein [Gammaproteobacteria bacterium]
MTKAWSMRAALALARTRSLAALGICLVAGASGGDSAPRFVPLEVFLDSPQPVAAWQFELEDRNAAMKVVGVENGDSDAFQRAPYYDREAVQRGQADRIVVADYSLADERELPSGRVRVATVHLMLDGAADFELTLVTANTADGRPIREASVSLQETQTRER